MSSLGVDRVCVIIGRTRHKMMITELEESVKRGAAFIELRLDFLAKAVDFRRLLPLKKCPWVATLRRPADGGRWPGTEPERKTIMRQAIVSGFDWIDLETDIAHEIPRFRDVKRIISYHNLGETPDDLEEIHARMCKQDADIVKIAVTAQSPMDNIRVLKIIQNSKVPTVGHCMGEMGFPSRILSLKYGAPFTYAAFNKERGIAPGLPSMDDLRRIYNINAINADTQVFGVIGDPVAHSFSPNLHNQMFQKLGINAVYLPFRVPRGELQATIKGFEMVPVTGYSVTIPHKEGAAALARERDNRVMETGAANTLVRRPDGFHAWNTDFQAAIDSIKTNSPRGEDNQPKPLNECHAMVLGAGGAARAVVHGLKLTGIHVHIASRTLERAQALAKEVDGKAVDWEGRHNTACDVIVNCTPIGMHPNVDSSPVHKSFLKPGTLVFDTVYNPESTLLVKDARERGCIVVTGLEMFVRQASLQFQLFTGQTGSLDVMRAIMRRALSPLTAVAKE
ncbi:MAG: shikimate dehydrogenase [Planctomycetes bacterium]|nr:shikimate dehydrogenase [Planctomycetota bacterium]